MNLSLSLDGLRSYTWCLAPSLLLCASAMAQDPPVSSLGTEPADLKLSLPGDSSFGPVPDAVLADVSGDGSPDALYLVDGELRYLMNPGHWTSQHSANLGSNLAGLALLNCEHELGQVVVTSQAGALQQIYLTPTDPFMGTGGLVAEPILSPGTAAPWSSVDGISTATLNTAFPLVTYILVHDKAAGLAHVVLKGETVGAQDSVLFSTIALPANTFEVAAIRVMSSTLCPQVVAATSTGIQVLDGYDGSWIAGFGSDAIGGLLSSASNGTDGDRIVVAQVVQVGLEAAKTRLTVWDTATGSKETTFPDFEAGALTTFRVENGSNCTFMTSATTATSLSVTEYGIPPGILGFEAPHSYSNGSQSHQGGVPPLAGSLDFDGEADVLVINGTTGVATRLTTAGASANDANSDLRAAYIIEDVTTSTGPTLTLTYCKDEQYLADSTDVSITVWAWDKIATEFLDPDPVGSAQLDITNWTSTDCSASSLEDIDIELTLGADPPEALAIEFTVLKLESGQAPVRHTTKHFLYACEFSIFSQLLARLPRPTSDWWSVPPITDQCAWEEGGSSGGVATSGIIRTPNIPPPFPTDIPPSSPPGN